jgi:predicted 3-demethylubiquinone-9 3-methyltransferase (glyoxalase superfamily)
LRVGEIRELAAARDGKPLNASSKRRARALHTHRQAPIAHRWVTQANCAARFDTALLVCFHIFVNKTGECDMTIVQKITPCLWFDDEAEEAAKFYVSIFRNSGIQTVTQYGKEGFEGHGKPPGSVLTVTFRLEHQTFTALNGGSKFTLSPAISLVTHCESQAEVDHFWGKLGEGGDPRSQACGWLKDKFGLSWQIVPEAFSR